MKIYNTLTKKKEEFVPLEEGKPPVRKLLRQAKRAIREKKRPDG